MATSRTKTAAARTNAVGHSNPSEDPRVRHDNDADARGSMRREDDARANDDGTALTVEQRRAMIRNEFVQEALPSVPPIPGYHLCWLSTTNSYDPIHKRMRLGYVPVQAEELQGFDSMKMKSGEFAGAISCNEMVLFKIDEDMYQMMMQEFHHNMPAEEEEALKRQLVRDEVDSSGKKLGGITEDSDGFQELMQRQKPKVGIFS